MLYDLFFKKIGSFVKTKKSSSSTNVFRKKLGIFLKLNIFDYTRMFLRNKSEVFKINLVDRNHHSI